MKTTVLINEKAYEANLEKGFDISIGIGGTKQVSAYGIPNADIKTYVDGGFVGDVSQGGSCNVRSIHLNPHGNGTHTECVGHVSNPYITIDSVLRNFFFTANLISIDTETAIELAHLEKLKSLPTTEALIIRTLPNHANKLETNYAGKGAIYLHPLAMQFIVDLGIKHLVVDLPSVDHETDPDLQSHKVFWQTEKNLKSTKTITELVYIPNQIEDGLYLMNLMLPNMHLDAVPSRPILYPLR